MQHTAPPFAHDVKLKLCTDIIIPLLPSSVASPSAFDLSNPAVIPSSLLRLYASVWYLGCNIYQ